MLYWQEACPLLSDPCALQSICFLNFLGEFAARFKIQTQEIYSSSLTGQILDRDERTFKTVEDFQALPKMESVSKRLKRNGNMERQPGMNEKSSGHVSRNQDQGRSTYA